MLRAEADPSAASHLVYAINRTTRLADFATGCDADIGGKSECTLDLDEEGDGRFWGHVERDVRPEWRGKVRGGYAGFRNKVSEPRSEATTARLLRAKRGLPRAKREHPERSENTSAAGKDFPSAP